MALAQDSLSNAAAGYKKLEEAIKQVDMRLFSGEVHLQWMKLSAQLLQTCKEVVSADNIARSRELFDKLSKTVIVLHKQFGHADGEFYLTFCPMAFDNGGAYWLQTEPMIWNSFYGSAMLRCGSVKDSFPAGPME